MVQTLSSRSNVKGT